MQDSLAYAAFAPEVPIPDTIELIYERRARQLWSFGRRLGLDGETAEDVMQEAFMRLISHRTPAVSNTDAWLFRVVHNLAVDHLRRTPRTDDAAMAAAARHPSTLVDDRIALWGLVDGLPQRQRAIIYLRYRVDLEFRVIANILGITEGGARSNCARALESLRSAIAER